MRTQTGNFKSDNASRIASIPTRWYVVANRVDAVFYQDSKDSKFKFVHRMKNEEGNLTEGELDSARPGTGFSSAGSGTIRHGLDRTFNHHELVAVDFAGKIANELAKHAKAQAYAELVITAEPHFLGLLRAALPASVRGLIKAEVNREYAQGSDSELYEHILRAIEN